MVWRAELGRRRSRRRGSSFMRYFTPARLTISLAMLIVLGAPHGAAAQDARLNAKLPRETAVEVSRLIDSARSLALPTDPLVGVALEGANRHAARDRIVRAVREYIGALRASREALGDGASDAEVVSGA